MATRPPPLSPPTNDFKTKRSPELASLRRVNDDKMLHKILTKSSGMDLENRTLDNSATYRGHAIFLCLRSPSRCTARIPHNPDRSLSFSSDTFLDLVCFLTAGREIVFLASGTCLHRFASIAFSLPPPGVCPERCLTALRLGH